MSATDPKGGESSCDYSRDVYPRRDVLRAVAHQEHSVRRIERERWERKMQAAMPCEPAALVEEFGTWVQL